MIVLRGYLAHRRRARIIAARVMPAFHGGPRHWLWWAICEEFESAALSLCVAFDEHVPLPASWDLAVSRWVGRRRERRWPGFTQPHVDLPGWCSVCAARWRVGRFIKHRVCAQAVERAADPAR